MPKFLNGVPQRPIYVSILELQNQGLKRQGLPPKTTNSKLPKSLRRKIRTGDSNSINEKGYMLKDLNQERSDDNDCFKRRFS